MRAHEFISENFGLNYPQTWDETNKPFIKKGQRRIGDLTEIEDVLDEKWSAKYKRSINCKNPKGFSQRAHCQGRNK
jgi:hypothetical protein